MFYDDMKMVQQDGMALKYVKEQTPEICVAAMKQNPSAAKFVKKEVADTNPEVKVLVDRSIADIEGPKTSRSIAALFHRRRGR